MRCAGLLYLLALVYASLWLYIKNMDHRTQRYPVFTIHQQHGTQEIHSSYLLVHALCWFIVFTSTSLCLGVWLYINNMDHRRQRYPVHTSWYMLCACLLYLLALVCAWVYDYTSTTWITEQRDTQFISIGRCFVLVYLFTSTSLCLRVWLYINNMEHKTQQCQVHISWNMLCTSLSLGVWLYIKNMDTRTQKYQVHTSWYMLCAGLLYLLALACAWEYDYTSTTQNTEHRDTKYISLGTCFVLVYCIY